MSKIWRETFGVGQEDRDRDERYARLTEALVACVDLPTLMVGDAQTACQRQPRGRLVPERHETGRARRSLAADDGVPLWRCCRPSYAARHPG